MQFNTQEESRFSDLYLQAVLMVYSKLGAFTFRKKKSRGRNPDQSILFEMRQDIEEVFLSYKPDYHATYIGRVNEKKPKLKDLLAEEIERAFREFDFDALDDPEDVPETEPLSHSAPKSSSMTQQQTKASSPIVTRTDETDDSSSSLSIEDIRVRPAEKKSMLESNRKRKEEKWMFETLKQKFQSLDAAKKRKKHQQHVSYTANTWIFIECASMATGFDDFKRLLGEKLRGPDGVFQIRRDVVDVVNAKCVPREDMFVERYQDLTPAIRQYYPLFWNMVDENALESFVDPEDPSRKGQSAALQWLDACLCEDPLFACIHTPFDLGRVSFERARKCFYEMRLRDFFLSFFRACHRLVEYNRVIDGVFEAAKKIALQKSVYRKRQIRHAAKKEPTDLRHSSAKNEPDHHAEKSLCRTSSRSPSNSPNRLLSTSTQSSDDSGYENDMPSDDGMDEEEHSMPDTTAVVTVADVRAAYDQYTASTANTGGGDDGDVHSTHDDAEEDGDNDHDDAEDGNDADDNATDHNATDHNDADYSAAAALGFPPVLHQPGATLREYHYNKRVAAEAQRQRELEMDTEERRRIQEEEEQRQRDEAARKRLEAITAQTLQYFRESRSRTKNSNTEPEKAAIAIPDIQILFGHVLRRNDLRADYREPDDDGPVTYDDDENFYERFGYLNLSSTADMWSNESVTIDVEVAWMDVLVTPELYKSLVEAMSDCSSCFFADNAAEKIAVYQRIQEYYENNHVQTVLVQRDSETENMWDVFSDDHQTLGMDCITDDTLQWLIDDGHLVLTEGISRVSSDKRSEGAFFPFRVSASPQSTRVDFRAYTADSYPIEPVIMAHIGSYARDRDALSRILDAKMCARCTPIGARCTPIGAKCAPIGAVSATDGATDSAAGISRVSRVCDITSWKTQPLFYPAGHRRATIDKGHGPGRHNVVIATNADMVQFLERARRLSLTLKKSDAIYTSILKWYKNFIAQWDSANDSTNASDPSMLLTDVHNRQARRRMLMLNAICDQDACIECFVREADTDIVAIDDALMSVNINDYTILYEYWRRRPDTMLLTPCHTFEQWKMQYATCASDCSRGDISGKPRGDISGKSPGGISGKFRVVFSQYHTIPMPWVRWTLEKFTSTWPDVQYVMICVGSFHCRENRTFYQSEIYPVVGPTVRNAISILLVDRSMICLAPDATVRVDHETQDTMNLTIDQTDDSILSYSWSVYNEQSLALDTYRAAMAEFRLRVEKEQKREAKRLLRAEKKIRAALSASLPSIHIAQEEDNEKMDPAIIADFRTGLSASTNSIATALADSPGALPADTGNNNDNAHDNSDGSPHSTPSVRVAKKKTVPIAARKKQIEPPKKPRGAIAKWGFPVDRWFFQTMLMGRRRNHAPGSVPLTLRKIMKQRYLDRTPHMVLDVYGGVRCITGALSAGGSGGGNRSGSGGNDSSKSGRSNSAGGPSSSSSRATDAVREPRLPPVSYDFLDHIYERRRCIGYDSLHAISKDAETSASILKGHFNYAVVDLTLALSDVGFHTYRDVLTQWLWSTPSSELPDNFIMEVVGTSDVESNTTHLDGYTTTRRHGIHLSHTIHPGMKVYIKSQRRLLVVESIEFVSTDTEWHTEQEKMRPRRHTRSRDMLSASTYTFYTERDSMIRKDEGNNGAPPLSSGNCAATGNSVSAYCRSALDRLLEQVVPVAHHRTWNRMNPDKRCAHSSYDESVDVVVTPHPYLHGRSCYRYAVVSLEHATMQQLDALYRKHSSMYECNYALGYFITGIDHVGQRHIIWVTGSNDVVIAECLPVREFLMLTAGGLIKDPQHLVLIYPEQDTPNAKNLEAACLLHCRGQAFVHSK